jgi:hypothetical protein
VLRFRAPLQTSVTLNAELTVENSKRLLKLCWQESQDGDFTKGTDQVFVNISDVDHSKTGWYSALQSRH